MSEWLFVADLPDLRRHKKKQVLVAGEAVALFLIADKIFALRDTCIHKERSLSKGVVLRGKIVCPGHQWSFDPATGYVEDQDQCQPTYDVRVEGQRIYINPEARVRVHRYDGIGSV